MSFKSSKQPQIPALPDHIGVFPLRDTVVFPGVPAQLSSARPQTIRLISEAVETDQWLCLLTEKHPVDTPGPENLYTVGTAAKAQRMWHLPDGSIRVLVQGICRIEVLDFLTDTPHLSIRPRPLPATKTTDPDIQALSSGASSLFQQILSLTPHLPEELQIAVINITDPDRLSDFIAFHLNLDLSEKQTLLESTDVAFRLRQLSQAMTQEIDVLEMGQRIRTRVHTELDRSRREFLIREQIKALHRELGESDTRTVETETLRLRLSNIPLTAEARTEAERELDRLVRLPLGAPEYAACRTYLDWLIDFPWATPTPETIHLDRAQRLLDADHQGLETVKMRILEELAVYQLGGGSRGSVLCLVGPPGVGKTSLGQSIARALGRRFMRLALGGLRDEAELRGHRRTYINAMPGRLIQGLCRSGSRNPVVMLDEIDKIGQGIGDPAGALLEIFDPEQNAAFVDHYFNVPVDLSPIFFIATANVISNVPEALRDRLEVIELPGYLESEKLAIAQKHLLPRQKIAHGLNQKQLTLKSAALRHLITHYTREPGLRNLERVLGTLCRKAARGIADGSFTTLSLSPKELPVYLGLPPFQDALSDNRHLPGLATGLAATPSGGQLFYIEATAMPGSGELILTGHLGDVMKESARAALSYVRTRKDLLPHLSEQIGKSDIHLHVPATSVPKDGPSAGLPMAVCLISLFTQTPVHPGLAFTGEITLTGRILGVGAIQDKLLAARRSGIRQVVLPEANRTTLESIPKATLRGLHLCFVHTIEEAFQIAFKRK